MGFQIQKATMSDFFFSPWVFLCQETQKEIVVSDRALEFMSICPEKLQGCGRAEKGKSWRQQDVCRGATTTELQPVDSGVPVFPDCTILLEKKKKSPEIWIFTWDLPIT